MHYAGHISPNVQRSAPLLRPAHQVFGWTPMQQARALVAQAEQALPVFRANLLLAHAELGFANSWRVKETRPRRRAAAMRCINAARRVLLATHRQLDAARAEVARLEAGPELTLVQPAPAPAPAPTGHRVLHEDAGTFPAGTVVSVVRSTGQGWHATITQPGSAGGVATHHDTAEAAWAWVDATLAHTVLH